MGALVESGQNAHSWDAAEWHDADNPELGTDAQLESAGATLLHRAAGQGDRAGTAGEAWEVAYRFTYEICS